jgi:cysteine desulfuration protein SufE
VPYPQKLQYFLDDIRDIRDRTLRGDILIELSDRFQEVPPSVATRPFPAANKVPACESDAYVWATHLPDGTLKFYFAVENPQGVSAKSLAVILDENLSGLSPSEIATISEDLVHEIFGPGVAMGKGEGLMGIVRSVKSLALGRLL